MRRTLLLSLRWHVSAMLLVSLLSPSPASAGPIDPRELIVLVESTIVDFDVSMIGIHRSHASGNNSSGAFTYASVLNSTGWNGTLSGSNNGLPASINYSGVLTPVGGPNNQFTFSYTSNWLIQNQTGTGSGSGIYTDPEFSFGVDLTNMSVSGDISVNYSGVSLTLSGAKTAGGKAEVSGTIAAGDLPFIDVSLVSGSIGFSLDQATGAYISELSASAFNFIPLGSETINEGMFRLVGPGINDPGINETNIVSTTAVVPEPASLLLLGTTMAGLGLATRWRQRRRDKEQP